MLRRHCRQPGSRGRPKPRSRPRPAGWFREGRLGRGDLELAQEALKATIWSQRKRALAWTAGVGLALAAVWATAALAWQKEESTVTVFGTVVDNDGRLAADVDVFGSTRSPGEGWGQVVTATRTDGEGRFRLELPAADGDRSGPKPGRLWAYQPGRLVGSLEVRPGHGLSRRACSAGDRSARRDDLRRPRARRQAGRGGEESVLASCIAGSSPRPTGLPSGSRPRPSRTPMAGLSSRPSCRRRSAPCSLPPRGSAASSSASASETWRVGPRSSTCCRSVVSRGGLPARPPRWSGTSHSP